MVNVPILLAPAIWQDPRTVCKKAQLCQKEEQDLNSEFDDFFLVNEMSNDPKNFNGIVRIRSVIFTFCNRDLSKSFDSKMSVQSHRGSGCSCENTQFSQTPFITPFIMFRYLRQLRGQERSSGRTDDLSRRIANVVCKLRTKSKNLTLILPKVFQPRLRSRSRLRSSPRSLKPVSRDWECHFVETLTPFRNFLCASGQRNSFHLIKLVRQ